VTGDPFPDQDTRQDLTTPELLAGDGGDPELEPSNVEAHVIDGEVVEAEVVYGDGAPPVDIELPDDPAEAKPILLDLLNESRSEAASYLDAMQRIAAEFENFRKRTARERDEIIDRASLRLIERLLPALDSFDAALGCETQTEGEARLIAGMADTHRQLMEALAIDGFEPIAADDVPFDPAVHEAVTGPGEEGDGELVVTELRRGYMLRGRVVRAALVAVRHA
jgi:molecular chaperone GrpE